MKSSTETGFELRLGGQQGCVPHWDPPRTVKTVAEARSAILRHALDALGHHAHDPKRRAFLRLRVPVGGPTGDALIKCEEERLYDPADPDAGMTCSYLLYCQGDVEGVGGLMWTYAVAIWATAPPEVWDHPADQPAGPDSNDDPDDDLRNHALE